MTVCTPHHEDLSGGGWCDSGPFSEPQAMHTIRPLVECVACCWQKMGCIIRGRSWLLLVVMHTWPSQHAYKLYACVGYLLYASVGFRGWYWPSAYLMADNMQQRCLLSLRSSPATMHTCLAVCSSEPLLLACCIHAVAPRPSPPRSYGTGIRTKHITQPKGKHTNYHPTLGQVQGGANA
jgi:hypothetical protein